MALLKKTARIKYLKDLGFGEYNKENILKMQKKYFHDPKEWDGRWGKHTDALARHLHNVWKYCKNFDPEEFECPCGKCTGYPTWMRAKELKHVQTIRDHYGKPMNVTSGLRCMEFNMRVGGVENSAHLKGLAVDFVMPTVTDTFTRRKTAINYIKGLPNHKYSYCNGWNSYGKKPIKAGMGSAIHTEVKP